jgi:hypothetical protein
LIIIFFFRFCFFCTLITVVTPIIDIVIINVVCLRRLFLLHWIRGGPVADKISMTPPKKFEPLPLVSSAFFNNIVWFIRQKKTFKQRSHAAFSSRRSARLQSVHVIDQGTVMEDGRLA